MAERPEDAVELGVGDDEGPGEGDVVGAPTPPRRRCKGDEIALMTRSMLPVMLELAATVHVPETDVAARRAAPGLVDTQPAGAPDGPPVSILRESLRRRTPTSRSSTTGAGSGSPTRTSSPSTASRS